MAKLAKPRQAIPVSDLQLHQDFKIFCSVNGLNMTKTAERFIRSCLMRCHGMKRPLSEYLDEE